jgi:hypothetical protein
VSLSLSPLRGGKWEKQTSPLFRKGGKSREKQEKQEKAGRFTQEVFFPYCGKGLPQKWPIFQAKKNVLFPNLGKAEKRAGPGPVFSGGIYKKQGFRGEKMRKAKKAFICQRCGAAVEVSGQGPRRAMTGAEVSAWMEKFYKDPKNLKEYLKEARKTQDFLAAAEKTYAEDKKARGKAPGRPGAPPELIGAGRTPGGQGRGQGKRPEIGQKAENRENSSSPGASKAGERIP